MEPAFRDGGASEGERSAREGGAQVCRRVMRSVLCIPAANGRGGRAKACLKARWKRKELAMEGGRQSSAFPDREGDASDLFASGDDVAPSIPALALRHTALQPHALLEQARAVGAVAPVREPAKLVDVRVRGHAHRALRRVVGHTGESARRRDEDRWWTGPTRHSNDRECESGCDRGGDEEGRRDVRLPGPSSSMRHSKQAIS